MGLQSCSFHHTTKRFDTESKSGRTKGSSQKIWIFLSSPWLRGVVRSSKWLQYDIWFIRFLGVEQNKMVDPHLSPTASLWQPHPQPVLGWVMNNGLISFQQGVLFFFLTFQSSTCVFGGGKYLNFLKLCKKKRFKVTRYVRYINEKQIYVCVCMFACVYACVYVCL